MVARSKRLRGATCAIIVVVVLTGVSASAAIAQPKPLDPTLSGQGFPDSTPTTMSWMSIEPDPSLPEDVHPTGPALGNPPGTMSSISTVPDPSLPEDVNTTLPVDTTVTDQPVGSNTIEGSENSVPVNTGAASATTLPGDTTTEMSAPTMTGVPVPSVIHAGGGGTARTPGSGIGFWMPLVVGACLGLGIVARASGKRASD